MNGTLLRDLRYHLRQEYLVPALVFFSFATRATTATLLTTSSKRSPFNLISSEDASVPMARQDA